VFLDREGRVRNGWRVLLFFFAGLLVALPIGVPYALLGPRGLWPWWLPEPLLMAIPAFVVSWIFLSVERRPLHSIGLKMDRRWGLEFLLGTLGGVLLMVATALVVRAGDGFHWVRNPAGTLGQMAAQGWIYLLVAWDEELIFRGYAFQRLSDGTRPWISLLFYSGLFFAYVHWGNPGMTGATKFWGSLNILLAGLLLGLCYLRTGSLAAPIGLHLGWNWTQGCLLGFGVSGTSGMPGAWTPVFHNRPEWFTGAAFGLEASIPCAVLSTAAILGLWLWRRPLRKVEA
jgi:hypothetical protein